MTLANVPNTENWKVATFRLTAFPAPSPQSGNPSWWEELTGEIPDKMTTQPRTGAQAIEGMYNDKKLILNIHPQRINWVYLVHVDLDIMRSATNSILDDLKPFHELMNRWFDLKDCPSLTRLAFGANLLQPIENIAEGYDFFTSLIPVALDATNSSDFLYQINRPRVSKGNTSDLKMNRLSKWSVGQHVQVEVLPQTNVTTQVYTCHLELDINTSQDFDGEFVPQDLSGIFDELIDLGIEIAENGDKP